MTKAVNHIKYTPCSGKKCPTSINLKKGFELAKWGVFRGCWVEGVVRGGKRMDEEMEEDSNNSYRNGAVY